MDETHMHPTRDEQSLALDHSVEQRQRWTFRVPCSRKVTIDNIAGEPFNGFDVAARGEILEGPDAYVTRRDAGQYSPAQRTFSKNTFTG